MNRIGLRMIFGARGRCAALIFGLAFAVLLSTQQGDGAPSDNGPVIGRSGPVGRQSRSQKDPPGRVGLSGAAPPPARPFGTDS
jgi:hypothetical protein